MKIIKDIVCFLYAMWGVLFPILIKGIYVYHFIPEAISGKGTRIMWIVIGIIIILSSMAAAVYGLWNFEERHNKMKKSWEKVYKKTERRKEKR